MESNLQKFNQLAEERIVIELDMLDNCCQDLRRELAKVENPPTRETLQHLLNVAFDSVNFLTHLIRYRYAQMELRSTSDASREQLD